MNAIFIKSMAVALFCMLLSLVYAAPTANFEVHLPSSLCVPVTINLNNTSTDASSFRWELNGVFFSNQNNPSRTITQGGVYEICLEASDDSGAIDTYCESIELFNPPTVDFNANISKGCTPLAVVFSGDTDKEIKNWRWDFGDGTVKSTAESTIEHTYVSSNIYTVTLTATDINDCETTITKAKYIEAESAVDFDFFATDTRGCNIPHTITFESVINGDDNGLEYSWDFGDGSSLSIEKNPEHVYTKIGNYTISLILTDPATGCSSIVEKESFVQLGELAEFDYTQNNEGSCSEIEVSFSLKDDTNVASLLWNFGDGITSSELEPTHTYKSIGCYYPSVTVISDIGCEATTTAKKCITVDDEVVLDYETIGAKSVCVVPYEVDFQTDFSGTVEWAFGTEGTSTNKKPSFTFTKFGTYPITLKTTLNNGCVQTFTKDTIVIKPLRVDFNSETEEGCLPISIKFRNLIDKDLEIKSYLWDFGFTTSDKANPTINFTKPGEHNVRLTIETESGCVATDIKRDFIKVGEPVDIDFEASPREICINEEIEFQDLSGDNATSWYWDFGDGGTSTEQHPKYQYSNVGLFDVKLVVWNYGCADSLIYENYIKVNEPKANFEYIQNCEDAQTISFNNLSIGADTWEWDFGDGNTSTALNPNHIYNQGGTYIVKLSVENNETNCIDVKTDTILASPLKAMFEVEDYEGCIKFKTKVKDLTIGDGLYEWNVPGGDILISEGEENEPYFVFPRVGIYTGITLTVTDGDCVSTYELPRPIVVSNIITRFDVIPIQDECAGQTFQFIDKSLSRSEVENIKWEWDFGDGNISNEQNPIHTFTQSGFYTPILTVTNAVGCSRSAAHDIPLTIQTPDVGFYVYEIGCTGEEMLFSNTSKGSFQSYIWDFGDGTTSTEINPTHSFSKTGVYRVCLSGTEPNGCVGSSCKEVTINAPTADFEGDNLFATCPTLEVNFTDLSEDATAWEWDFGDNSGVATIQNPTHIYTQGGAYTVCLTITTDGSCKTTHCKEKYINIGGPSGEFSFDPKVGCKGTEITFIGNSAQDARYRWDFGDGILYENNDFKLTETISHIYETVGTFYPVLIMEDENGCQVVLDANEPVVIEPFAFAKINTEESILCGGQTFQLEAQTVGAITWFPSEGLSCTDCPTPIANPTVTTKYFLMASSGNGGCMAMDSITLTRNPIVPPIITVGASSERICPNDVVQLSVNSNQSTTTYHWDNSMNLSCYSCQNPIVENLDKSTTFYVTATTGGGCSTMDSIRIEVEDEGVELLGTDKTICNGGSIQLNLANGSNPIWSPSEGLNCINCPNPIASPSTTTTYMVKATGPSGCLLSDEIIVYVIQEEEVSAGSDQYICLGEEVQLMGDMPSGEFSWINEGILITDENINPIVQPTETTSYIFSVTNGDCIIQDTVEILVAEKTTVMAEDVEICVGDTAQLNVFGNATTIEWYPSTGLSDVNINNPIANPTITTKYYVIGQTGTCQADTVDLLVTVRDKPKISLPESKTFIRGDEVQLEVLTDNVLNYNYKWSPAQFVSCEFCPDPVVRPIEPMTVYVEAMDDMGCMAVDSTTFRLASACDDNAFIVPNAFTPNGDGNNDQVFVRSQSELSIFRVYDRWGKLIFETQFKERGWDGTYLGKPLNRGVYTYYLEGRCRIDGERIFKKGDITLMR